MSKRASVMIEADVKNLIIDICQDNNMGQGVLVAYLVEQCIKYGMLDPNWIDRLTEAEFQDKLREAEIEYRKKYEQDKHRAILATKQLLIKEYLKTMDKEEKKAYIETALNMTDEKSGANLLDDMTSYQMFTVNGERKMLPPDGTNRPRLPGIAPSQIIQCEAGFHVINDPCLSCSMRETCPQRIEEYTNWVAVHGTKKQQEEWLRRHG